MEKKTFLCQIPVSDEGAICLVAHATIEAMSIFIGYISAIEYWRHVERPPGDRGSRAELRYGHMPSEEQAVEIASAYIRVAGPLHVIVGSKAFYGMRAGIACHVHAARIPARSFYLVAPDLYVLSPEACFVLMATVLTFVQLVALGDELCGTYCIDAEADGGMRNRRWAPTSVARIQFYIDRATGMHGVDAARRALKYVVDGSNSPRETELEMRLCLPRRVGGYGLVAPLMNHRIDLDEEAARMAGQDYCLCDLFWPQANLDLEYDGEQGHAGERKRVKDVGRRFALEHEGVHERTITKLQYFQDQTLGYLAGDLVKELGVRFLEPDRQKLYALKDELAEWSRSGTGRKPGNRS